MQVLSSFILGLKKMESYIIQRTAFRRGNTHGELLFMNAHQKRVFGVPGIQKNSEGIFGARRITAETLVYGQKVRGLDEINYHIRNSDLNLCHNEFVGRSAFTTRQRSPIGQFAFSNFVISIDILLPAKNAAASVLTSYLGTLIEHGRCYTGEMNLDAELADPELTNWSERVND